MQTRDSTIATMPWVMSLLYQAQFATTVAQLRQLPRTEEPEVAFVGRSNAGKSSAINALCQRRRLAFSSRMPGRTQALNFFALGIKQAGDEPLAYLVDTPGYGYAQAPQEVKKDWDHLAGGYLARRRQLAGIVLIMDVRRGLTERDRAVLAWADPQVPVMVVMSKCDKLGRQAQQQARQALTQALAREGIGQVEAIVAFSATTRLGLDEAAAVIERWLRSRFSGTGETDAAE